MYYLSSENKGADQLRSYCEADLRLCFRIISKIPVFSWRGSNKLIDSFPFVLSCILNSFLTCFNVIEEKVPKGQEFSNKYKLF